MRSASVDVCDSCGVWLDWFDGSVRALAAEMAAVRENAGRPAAWAGPSSDEVRNLESRTKAACPRCAQILSPELYRFEDAIKGELVTGVDLLRCTDCVGCFVPWASANLLLDRAREPRPSTLWELLVLSLKRLVSRG